VTTRAPDAASVPPAAAHQCGRGADGRHAPTRATRRVGRRQVEAGV